VLLYSTNEEPAMKYDLWVLPLDGSGGPRPFVSSPFDEDGGRFSPDGRQVAYVSDESGRKEVYVRPFPEPGAARQVSTGGGSQPRWSRDGRALYFESASRLYRARPPFDADPELLFEEPDVVSYEPAPDGKRILAVLRSDFEASPPTRILTSWRALLERRLDPALVGHLE
jgi:hypothetical protein